MIKQITSFLIYFVFIIKINAQVPTSFTWNGYSCAATATANSYTYSQTSNGVTMYAAVYYSGTAAAITWSNTLSTCSSKSPAYNSGMSTLIPSSGLFLCTDRLSSGTTAPTPTVTLTFSPALCGAVTFSIADVNGANNSFRDSIRINAWDGNNNPITMTPSMVTRSGGATYPYPPFVNLSTNLIVYGNSDYTNSTDAFTIPASAPYNKVSKINIIYYSGKVDYNLVNIPNPSNQFIMLSQINGNAPPTVTSSFACQTNSTTVNLIAAATNTSATHTYTWTTATGTINSGSSALTANVKSPSTYTFTAYNGAPSLGCSTQTVISLSSVNCSLLPIELTDFYASLEDKNVMLNWETYTELNSNYFIVERSSDGVEFESISQLQSSKTSNQFKQYQFLDKDPFPKINYYRLKLIDADGSSRYSKMIDVTIAIEKIVVNNIKPNPARDVIYYDIHTSKKTNINIELVDFTGIKVFEEQKSIKEGKSTENLNLEYLAQGAYILKISSANSVLKSYTKIIKN